VLQVRRRALIALIGAGILLPAAAGGVAATTGTYSISFCYSASDNSIHIHQVWSGMEVDAVTGGEGTGRNGFGFVNFLDTPATSGDETDQLLAANNARIVGGDVRDQGVVLGSGSVNKVHGSWAKSMPAC